MGKLSYFTYLNLAAIISGMIPLESFTIYGWDVRPQFVIVNITPISLWFMVYIYIYTTIVFLGVMFTNKHSVWGPTCHLSNPSHMGSATRWTIPQWWIRRGTATLGESIGALLSTKPATRPGSFGVLKNSGQMWPNVEVNGLNADISQKI